MEHEILKRISFEQPTYGSSDEVSIRHSLQRLFCLMDVAHVHKARLDVAGVYSEWDSMSKRMFGYDDEDVVGKLHLRKLFAWTEDYEHVMRIVTNHERFTGVVAFRRKDGYTVVVRLIVTKEYDEGGVLTGYLVSAVDRTDERKLEVQLENHLIMMAGSH
jgi:PAS domain S-box-containing protein